MTRAGDAWPAPGDGRQPDPAEALADALDRSGHRVRVGAAPAGRIVRGSRASLWDIISALRGRAGREILSLDDTAHLIARGVPDSIQQRGPATLRDALGRGVSVRQVTSRGGLSADRQVGAIVYRAGGQARVVPTVPAKFSVLDRRVAMLAIDSTVLADGFQIIQDAALVATLVGIHRDLWHAGTDPDAAADGLPPHLVAVLPALASGRSDEAASRRLGISPRSYSRRVAELLTVLGVQNRFQAGAEAARRGWL